MFVGEFNEDIFQAGGQRANVRYGDAVFLQLGSQVAEIEVVFDQCVDGFAKNGRAANAGNMPRGAQGTSDLRGDDLDAVCPSRLNIGKLFEFRGCTVGDELAVVNVSHVAAALGFVHVVGGDKKGDALAGK